MPYPGMSDQEARLLYGDLGYLQSPGMTHPPGTLGFLTDGGWYRRSHRSPTDRSHAMMEEVRQTDWPFNTPDTTVSTMTSILTRIAASQRTGRRKECTSGQLIAMLLDLLLLISSPSCFEDQWISPAILCYDA